MWKKYLKELQMLDEFKVILWDFDGVLMNSNSVRDLGFMKVLEDYPKHQVEALMTFHKQNGGLSRYVKFRHFFEQIRGESITEEAVQQLAKRFSVIMRELLFDKALLIDDSINFVRENHTKFKMHIVSGSDGTELNALCEFLGIHSHFISIHGSPTPKNQLVEQLLSNYKYSVSDCVLIGDSVNDLEAASVNDIAFFGYNNTSLNSMSKRYIDQFPE
jgi:phosphoglycolate phosphatase-like HAD superfamily hydrolase